MTNYFFHYLYYIIYHILYIYYIICYIVENRAAGRLVVLCAFLLSVCFGGGGAPLACGGANRRLELASEQGKGSETTFMPWFSLGSKGVALDTTPTSVKSCKIIRIHHCL